MTVNESAEKEKKAATVNSAELSQYLPQRTEENNTRTVKIAGTPAKFQLASFQIQNTIAEYCFWDVM
jgi:hypothetical protein